MGIVRGLNDKLRDSNNKDKEGYKTLRIPLHVPKHSGKALLSNSLWHRLKIQKDDLSEIQDIIRTHCPEFEDNRGTPGGILRELEEYMGIVKTDIKNN